MTSGKCPACNTSNEKSQALCNMCGARLPWADSLGAASGLLPPPPMATGIKREIPAHWFLLIVAAAFFGSFLLAQVFYGNGKSKKRARPAAVPAVITPAANAAENSTSNAAVNFAKNSAARADAKPQSTTEAAPAANANTTANSLSDADTNAATAVGR